MCPASGDDLSGCRRKATEPAAQPVGWSRGSPRRSRSGCRLYRCRFLDHAKAAVRTIVTLTKTLACFPRSGGKVPEFADQNTRESIAYSYRIIYTVEPDQVIIVALIPGKRML